MLVYVARGNSPLTPVKLTTDHCSVLVTLMLANGESQQSPTALFLGLLLLQRLHQRYRSVKPTSEVLKCKEEGWGYMGGGRSLQTLLPCNLKFLPSEGIPAHVHVSVCVRH